MFTVKITNNFPPQASKVKAEINRRHAELLNVLGVELLSRVLQAYQDKSKGRSGGIDGIKWKALDRKTLEARVRRRAPARRIVARRRQLAEQIRGTKGKGSTKRIQQLRQKRKERFQKLQSLIDKEVSRHMIGVDTGLQRASASPGFRGDEDGGNVFDVDAQASEVTVGFGRTYSEYFDEDRTLISDPLPEGWEADLDRIVSEHYEEILKIFEE